MNTNEKLSLVIQNLSLEQSQYLLQIAENFSNTQLDKVDFSEQMNSHIYQEWLDSDNDIYDEVFADEFAKE